LLCLCLFFLSFFQLRFLPKYFSGPFPNFGQWPSLSLHTDVAVGTK
jgi:hypothetical protein